MIIITSSMMRLPILLALLNLLVSAAHVQAFTSQPSYNSLLRLNLQKNPKTKGGAGVTMQATSLSSADQDASLSLKGGGFLAVAVHTGLTTGLLRALNDINDAEGTCDLKDSGLFNRIKTLASNSGGSWFASELLYSPTFLDLVESMATNGTNYGAAAMFRERWTEPWVSTSMADRKDSLDLPDSLKTSLSKATPGDSEREVSAQKKLDWQGLFQDIKLALHFFKNKTGLTWRDFVATLLDQTASLDKDMPLGARVNEWSNGKVWVINHSTVTTSEHNFIWKKRCVSALPFLGDLSKTSEQGFVSAERLFKIPFLRNLAMSDKIPYMKYFIQVAKGGEKPPMLMPARFSVVLGSAQGTPAPLPYAAPGVFAESRLHYDGKSKWVGRGSISSKAVKMGLGSEDTSFSGVSVSDAVTASSAFLGGLSTTSEGSLIESVINSDLSVSFASSLPGQTAFDEAGTMVNSIREKNSISQQEADKMAEIRMNSIIDGGYTENTGIANAVAAGAKEVYVWLDASYNPDDPNFGSNGFFGLFRGAPISNSVGAAGTMLQFCMFSKNVTEAQSEFRGFTKLTLSDSSEHLKTIRVGTIKTKTLSNHWLGIEGGIDVSLHVISVEANLNMGYLEDFNNYATLVGEITGAVLLPENRDNVHGILNSLSFGKEGFP